MKRFLSVFLTAVMLLALAAPLFPALAADDYIYCYTYSDIQVEKNSDLQRYGTNSNPITGGGGQDLPRNDSSRGVSNANLIYLAKNEREGFQVYFYEKGEGRTLRLEVGEFTNANGDVLPHQVFREEYFFDTGYAYANATVELADALVPCADTVEVQTAQNKNETFYIEVRSAADQPAGVYYADVKFYDDDTALPPARNTTKVAAVVWDFALPQQHYGNMVLGLYNSASGYGDSCYLLTQNGIAMNGEGNVVNPEDQARADAIIEGWNEYLLDHGISPYEIPRNLIDNDEKAAELAMADVRQKAFFVPLLNADVYNATYNSATLAKINQYKDLIDGNAYLTGKAHLYLTDEPAIGLDGEKYQPEIDALNDRINAAKAAWPELDRVITYCLGETKVNNNRAYLPFDSAVEVLNPMENTVCVNNSLLASRRGIYDSYLTKFAGKWRYPGDIQQGSMELWYYGKSTNGSLRRILFWQQSALQDDMFLYWQGAYYRSKNVWEDHTLPAGGGIQTGNGNGILLYPGTAIGQPAETPIGSLRIKQIASGIDDADYLALAKEFMGQEGYETALRRFLPNALTEGNPEKIFLWREESVGIWDMGPVNSARVALGNELEAAMGEHEFGDWNIVVTPDETHNGLAVRECANCGTQESKKIGLCDQGHHIYGEWTADNAETHTRKCEVCGIPKTAAHTPQTVTGSAPTCTTDGSTDSVVCADCGYVLTAAETLPGGHSFGEWTEGEEATCIQEGTAGHYTCSVCHKDFDADGNELATLVIPRNGANHVGELTVTNAADATCTQDGYTGDTVCSACGNVTIPGAAIPATGHRWNAGTVTKEATCTGKGEKTFACANCDATKTEEIAALGHTAANKDGKCDRCGATLVNACKLCGEVHQGFPGVLIGFFHRIIYFFQNLFKK